MLCEKVLLKDLRYLQYISRITALPNIEMGRSNFLGYSQDVLLALPLLVLYCLSLGICIKEISNNTNSILDYFTVVINSGYLLGTYVANFTNGSKVKQVLKSMDRWPKTGDSRKGVILLLMLLYAVDYGLTTLILKANTPSSYAAVSLSYPLSWAHALVLVNYVEVVEERFKKLNADISSTTVIQIQLPKAMERYQRLVGTALDLNSALGAHVLGVLVLNFLGIICHSNTFCQVVARSGVENRYAKAASLICWMAVMFVVVTIFVQSWVATSSEARKTPLLLHEYWNRFNPLDNKDVSFFNLKSSLKLLKLLYIFL